MTDNKQPTYEPEDDNCTCESLDPEWEWSEDELQWVCTGCGARS